MTIRICNNIRCKYRTVMLKDDSDKEIRCRRCKTGMLEIIAKRIIK